MTEQIKKLVSDQLGIPVDGLDDNGDLTEVYGADSLDIVDLILTIEDFFGLEIPDEEAIELRTVGRIASYIQENK